MLTGVQEGGVLKMRSGAVQFEFVAISNTSAAVRVESGRPIGPETDWVGDVVG
jgi:hypothetical protein